MKIPAIAKHIIESQLKPRAFFARYSSRLFRAFMGPAGCLHNRIFLAGRQWLRNLVADSGSPTNMEMGTS